ncbi:DUF5682 family protein [Psychrobium sp. MM17-31]|uniref:DUF5682 family protein n=1 Tax=Psychrobium sp. MM17-31 TaxID=2917758 RepID=UPI001EF54E0A|nr:DUF5682 family protein [Psychrobium sp. MM17-31]MCG7530744.1 DUF5682 family protein [Psychrobium sp. MM17-31]
MSNIHYFGIRHHGPGSSQRLISALEALQPARILIEGPTDCSELLSLLAHAEMKPPVALLAYATDDANSSVFYPFAQYSPEYQATLYAAQHNVEAAFIDVPVNIQLAVQVAAKESALSEDEIDTETEATDEHLATPAVVLDPIGELAKLADYQDGEAWWNDLIEQNSDDNAAIFDVVANAMGTLRQSIASDIPSMQRDLVREAYMRLEINKAKKLTDGPIAVVCGAWHVPALTAKHTLKADRELVKTLPNKLSAKKLKSTWIPWTSARLSVRSGYGAGIDAPMWYQHLWQYHNDVNKIERWLAQVCHELRATGHIVSTASVIEASRLCQTLAAVRNRPAVGFEEIREAVIACLCFGEQALWHQIEAKLLLGSAVGEIPADAPLIPLIEDLQSQQKKLKLKPEALPREVALDLRSDAGLRKSTLLHRLVILGVDWGNLNGGGKSRGTFRENWTLSWQPEFSVKLVENLVYGSSIELAASNKISEIIRKEKNLGQLANAVHLCLESQLDNAASLGIELLSKRAAHTSDCLELLESITPLIEISRYGTAREISLPHIVQLIERLTIQAALALPYACRNLDDDEAWHYRRAISDAHQALLLTDWDDATAEQWWKTLQVIIETEASTRQVSGLCSRLLYQAQRLSDDELEILLAKMLSLAIEPAQAARYFDGFFSDAVDRLLYDDVLLNAIEHWLIGIDEDDFVQNLPLFRRIFSDLDAMERKRLIDRVLLGREQRQSELVVNESMLETWPLQLARVSLLLKRNKAWQQ